MKVIMEGWRNWLDEEKVLLLWSKATGTPIEKLREGISRRDFLRGLGGMAATAAAPGALAGTLSAVPAAAGEEDTGAPGGPWVPADDDPRWGDSGWSGLEGYAAIGPYLIRGNESIARGAFTAVEYEQELKDWRSEDLLASLSGQRATIVHGDPEAGLGMGLERFVLEDDRSLKGRKKLPLSWSLMYKELLRRKTEGIDEAFDRLV